MEAGQCLAEAVQNPTQGDPAGLQLCVHLAGLNRNEHHPHTDHDQHCKPADKRHGDHVTKPNCMPQRCCSLLAENFNLFLVRCASVCVSFHKKYVVLSSVKPRGTPKGLALQTAPFTEQTAQQCEQSGVIAVKLQVLTLHRARLLVQCKARRCTCGESGCHKVESFMPRYALHQMNLSQATAGLSTPEQQPKEMAENKKAAKRHSRSGFGTCHEHQSELRQAHEGRSKCGFAALKSICPHGIQCGDLSPAHDGMMCAARQAESKGRHRTSRLLQSSYAAVLSAVGPSRLTL